jgi:hypothetical protein
MTIMKSRILAGARIAVLFAASLGVASVSAVGNLHPHFTVKHILPAELGEIGGIGGIDLLPNGDGVICTWGGSQKSLG